MDTPFDTQIEQARDRLDAANDAYNAMLDRLSARTAADDEPGGDSVEARQLFRDTFAECARAEVILAAYEKFVDVWRAAREIRPDVSEDALLQGFLRWVTGARP